MFNRSALDNILYGRPDAGREAAIAAAKDAAADEFIRELTIAEIAARQPIYVSQDQIDDFIHNQMTMVSFHLMEPKEQELWKAAIRRRLAVQQFLNRILLNQVSVTDEEINDYYSTNENDYKSDVHYRMRILQFSTEEKAKEFGKALKKTKRPFLEVAAEHLENQDYLLPVNLPLTALNQSFSRTVRRMRPGRYSKIIPIKQGEATVYYILYLEAITPESQVPFEEAYHEIRQKLEHQAAEALLEDMIKQYQSSIDLKVHEDSLPFTYQDPAQRSNL